MSSMSYGSSISSWRPWKWMTFDLTFRIWNIYINFTLETCTKFSSSSRRTKLKDMFWWNISQMIKYYPNQHKNQGFPGSLGKIAKHCIEITKSTFQGQISRGGGEAWRGQAKFLGAEGDPIQIPTLAKELCK